MNDTERPAKQPRRSRMLKSNGRAPLTQLQALLIAADVAAGDGESAVADDALTELLLALSPSALDLELRGLGVGVGVGDAAASINGLEELRRALDFFARQLATGRDYELLQASLAVFLRVHQEALCKMTQLLPAVQHVHRVQHSSWSELREALHGNLCLLSFLCRTQI